MANTSDSDADSSRASSAKTSTSAITVAPDSGAQSTDYVYLGDFTCRFIYKSSSQASKSRPIVCGRPVDGEISRGCLCSNHRNKAADRYSPKGYYIRVPLQSGGVICGLVPDSDGDGPLSAEGFNELKAQEQAEREQALRDTVKNLPDGWNDSDEESETPPTSGGRQPRVAIDPAANASYGARSLRQSGAPAPPISSAPVIQSLFVGHERADGKRAYSRTPENEERMCRHGWNSVALFDSMDKLNAWLLEAPANQCKPAAKKTKSKSKSSGGVPPEDPSSGSSSASDTGSSRSSSPKRKDKKNKKSSKSSHKHSKKSSKSSSRHHCSPSYSDDSRSASISTASSHSRRSRRRRKNSRRSSEESSRSHRRHRDHSRSRRSRTDRSPGEEAAAAVAAVRLFSKDASTGDTKSIFGLSLTDGSKLEEALCPPGMTSKKDRAGLASCLTDVMAMPGTYTRSTANERSDMEVMMEGTVALVAQATGNSLVLPDGQWKTERKARLSFIKASSDLLSLWDNIADAESEIFEQQDDRIRAYMSDRHYSTIAIDQFLTSGLFIRVITDTYTNYKSLLQTLFSHTTMHGFNGLASELIKYHGKKLLQIRLYSPNYLSMLLRQYIYMREAAAAKFSHVNVMGPLIQDLYDRALPPSSNNTDGGGGGNGGNGGNGSGDKCTYCQSKECHSKLGIGLGTSKCPFKAAGLPHSLCRKAAKTFLNAYTPSADKNEAIQAAIATVRPPAEQS